MQIQFDPRDPNACASVLATIAALHGSAAFDLARDKGYDSLAFGDKITGSVPIVPLGEMVSAAEAFDAPSPESAFPNPPAPVASPAADSAVATIPTPPPVPSPVAAPPIAPAPTVPAAPIASTPPVASPSSGVELDADGLPWDARIHSGPADKRPKNADGRWRRGRGVSDEQAAIVTAELRQVMGAPAPVAAPNAVPASPVPAPVAAAPIPAPPAPTPTPAPVAMETGPAVVTPAPSATVVTFADLMKKVTRMQTAGLVTVEATSAIAQSLGLTGVRDMINRPDLVPAFDALLPDEAA